MAKMAAEKAAQRDLGALGRRAAPVACALFLAMSCAGCLVVPVKAPRTKGPAGNIAKKTVDLRFLKEGITRQEVLQEIGWLDTGFKSERLFIARWLDSGWTAFWGVVAPTGAVAGGGERDWGAHTLLVEFDAGGRVKRFASLSDSHLLTTLADWTSSEPPLVLDPPLELLVEHFSLNGNHAARLRLASNGLSFHEPDSSKHYFALPLSSVRQLKFQGKTPDRGDLPAEPSASAMKVELQFARKTPAGKRVTLVTDVSGLITLLRFAQGNHIPMR
jgi:outer membrane protein assembly factor BamE (lipoprotein component of BamABCDE complex)